MTETPERGGTPSAAVTFVGNATTVLRLGEFTVLTDPAFGPAGSRVSLGYGLWTRRVKDPALQVIDLSALDGVLLSHLHGDHLDRFALARLPAALPVLTTPQAQRRLRRTRLTAVQGLPTWESHEWVRGDQRLRVTSVPGKHGPGVMNHLLPDVMGSVVELSTGDRLRLRLYITGDTLHGPHLAEIPRRCGEIGAMLIHLGGTRVLGMLVTMDDVQGVETTHLIRPGLTVPIHYDDYRVFKSPLADFLTRARDQGLRGIQPITRGDTVALPIRGGAAARPQV